MIEDITRTAITTLLVQGTGWVVAVLLGVWCWVLDNRNTKLQSDAQSAIEAQYEKRLLEFRGIMDAMTNSTSNMSSLQGSITTSAETINQLAAGFAKLLREFETQHGKWEDKGAHIQKQLEDVQRRLEALQRIKAV